MLDGSRWCQPPEGRFHVDFASRRDAGMGRESMAGTLSTFVRSGVPPGRKCFFYRYPVVAPPAIVPCPSGAGASRYPPGGTGPTNYGGCSDKHSMTREAFARLKHSTFRIPPSPFRIPTLTLLCSRGRSISRPARSSICPGPGGVCSCPAGSRCSRSIPAGRSAPPWKSPACGWSRLSCAS